MEGEIIKTAGELIESSGGGALDVVFDTVAGAGGVLLKEAGKIALGIPIRKGFEELFSRYKKAKDAGAIDEDFEKTVHGAKLLQDALNALLEGLDEERAKAVRQVFLGLAMNPPEDSFEKIRQIEILRLAAGLSEWEIAFLNALERYKKEVYHEINRDLWQSAKDEPRKAELRNQFKQQTQSFDEWLRKHVNKDQNLVEFMAEAMNQLNAKRLLDCSWQNTDGVSARCSYQPQGIYTSLGTKLAEYLYAATDDFKKKEKEGPTKSTG